MFKDTDLYKYADNLQKYKKANVFKDVLDNKFIKDLIVHLNTDEQLGKQRVNSLGARLGFYSEATQIITKGRKKMGEPFNLNDTGDFWDSWKVTVKDKLIEIDANGNKDGKNLFDLYGVDILGLNDDNLQILINEVTKFYIQYYRKYLFDY